MMSCREALLGNFFGGFAVRDLNNKQIKLIFHATTHQAIIITNFRSISIFRGKISFRLARKIVYLTLQIVFTLVDEHAEKILNRCCLFPLKIADGLENVFVPTSPVSSRRQEPPTHQGVKSKAAAAIQATKPGNSIN
jgi:hypothetical protein